MAKKKLKLKSLGDMKNSLKKENQKKKTKPKPKKIDEKRKDPNKRRKIGSTICMIFITFGILIASVVIAFGLYIVFTSPEFTAETLYETESTEIYWSDGTLLARLGEEDRVIKNYEDFPQVLVDALIATEDSRFFQHNGVDLARFLKASIGQVLGQSGAGGASTLSMQLSKNYFTSTEDQGIEGIIRKFQDIYMAVFKIEKNYTKEQIIEMYLNTWWFASGNNNVSDIYGVEQASQYYFGKSVSALSLPESALLVGMVNNPSLYHPYNNPEAANNRKNTVLSLMYRHGYITEQEMLDAQSIRVESLVVPRAESSTPYQVLIDYVVDEIQDKEKINLQKGGYKVYTTYNKAIQDVINNMQNGAADSWRDDKIQVGAAVTSVADGSIVALGPGRNYVKTGDNRALFRRQPGSTAKPLIDYGPLIEYNNASTGQMFIDFKYSYNGGGYLNNWDNQFLGVYTLKDALSASRNVTALEAFHQTTEANKKEFLNNLGIDEDNYGKKNADGTIDDTLYESYSVGGWPEGLSPLESSAAYAAFARSGYYIAPYSYTKIINTQTEETIEYKYEKNRAMSEETAWMITDVLLQATSEGVGGSINWNLRGSIASKSGTTNYDEATAAQKGVPYYATPEHWVNTYNTEYSISFVYGYDKKDEDSSHYLTSNTGTSTRSKISAYLANNILTKNEKFTKPDTVVSVTVERNTLPTKRASEYTPDNMKYQAYFKAGAEPSETSKRFSKLEDVTNAKGSAKDSKVTLTWNPIDTPAALNTNAVRTEFANYFSTFKKTYSNSYSQFENEYMRIYESYNTSSIGSLGYQIYLKDDKGNLTSLGWTENNSYTYTAPSSGTYTFVIKSSYSIFKTNQSNGVEVKVKIEGDEPAENSLKATATTLCVLKNGTVDAKKAVKVTFEGKDVTADATISASQVDTSTTGEKTITYTISYKGEQIRVSGKVNVSDSCSTE